MKTTVGSSPMNMIQKSHKVSFKGFTVSRAGLRKRVVTNRPLEKSELLKGKEPESPEYKKISEILKTAEELKRKYISSMSPREKLRDGLYHGVNIENLE